METVLEQTQTSAASRRELLECKAASLPADLRTEVAWPIRVMPG